MPGPLPLRFVVCLFAVACATPSDVPVEHQERIERAERGLEDDPLLEGHRAAVEAARAREQRGKLVDALEVRVGDGYLEDEHRFRALARVKVRHPVELKAEREVLRADTEIEVARLEGAGLERRVTLCFPSVEALVHGQRATIYAEYAVRQKALLQWNEDWRTSGVIDELSGARFELDSRVKLATRQPPPLIEGVRVPMQLPEIGAGAGQLLRSREHLRATTRDHHPSVGVRRATAERYRRLAERARARRLPGIRFVDLFYEHRTDRSRDGVGGQLAIDIPFGGEERADVRRYEALGRQQRSEANAIVEDQVALSLEALNDVHDFETSADRWLELERLAALGEQVADRWWKARAARPSQVAALLDDAYSARIAVLEARERAASAQCTLLAMTGVPLEAWPRE